MSRTIPQLIAHRGNSRELPENTLPALKSAVEAGARFVEFDVRLTVDEVPVLLHDESLDRTTGRPGLVGELPWSQLRDVVPSVSEAATLLAAWPEVTVFVDVKNCVSHRIDRARMMTLVLEALGPIRDRCVITGDDAETLAEARRIEARPVALVVFEVEPSGWSDLAPEYLFIDASRIPDDGTMLPHGPWRWVVYGVEDAERALAFGRRGADLIETKSFAQLHGTLHNEGHATGQEPHAA